MDSCDGRAERASGARGTKKSVQRRAVCKVHKNTKEVHLRERVTHQVRHARRRALREKRPTERCRLVGVVPAHGGEACLRDGNSAERWGRRGMVRRIRGAHNPRDERQTRGQKNSSSELMPSSTARVEREGSDGSDSRTAERSGPSSSLSSLASCPSAISSSRPDSARVGVGARCVGEQVNMAEEATHKRPSVPCSRPRRRPLHPAAQSPG